MMRFEQANLVKSCLAIHGFLVTFNCLCDRFVVRVICYDWIDFHIQSPKSMEPPPPVVNYLHYFS